MSKPKIIGIPGWDVKIGEQFGVTLPYMNWASQFGTVIILTPGYIPEIDLLLLPGGADVNPERYNEAPDWFTSRPNTFLENFDLHALPQYINSNTPVFGICRGLQTLNVVFGGSLYQDITHPTSSSPYEVDVHSVYGVNSHGMRSGKSEFKVGSWHHQAIKELGTGLKRCLLAHDDIVEAIEHETLPVAAVQWHPERCFDEYSSHVVERLLKYKK